LKLVLNYLCYSKVIIMKNKFFENSLGNETIEVLGFKTIDALEKEIELLIKEVEEANNILSYKN